MENLNDIIKFTVSGSYKRSAVNSYADYLGYSETLSLPSGTVPNPVSRVQFVEDAMLAMFIDKLAEMDISIQSNVLSSAYQSTLDSLATNVKNEIASNVTIASEVL